jgi:hypothetical protein
MGGLEDTENDLRELKMKRWRQTPNDGEQMASGVKKIRALRGP